MRRLVTGKCLVSCSTDLYDDTVWDRDFTSGIQQRKCGVLFRTLDKNNENIGKYRRIRRKTVI